MHEYSIVDALFRQIDVTVADRGAIAVKRVEVCIGELSGVECELLASAFDLLRENTICCSAELAIRKTVAAWECPQCGGRRKRGDILRCPTCDVPVRLLAGDEIILERLEVEVADVS